MAKEKILLIINPKAGKNKSRVGTYDIVEKFSSAEYDFTVKTTTCQGDATNIVKKYASDFDMVVCCGGDGTFNETINGVMQLPGRIPIGYIPAGSTNDLANTIGLPTDIGKATDVIIDGHTNGYDIGLFNNRFFSYIASFGAGTKLSYSTPQKLKNVLGHSAYMINGFVLQLIPTLRDLKPLHCKIEYDGGVLEDDFYFGSVSNSTSVAGLFKFNKDDVKLDDGKFEMLLVRGLSSPLEAFSLLGKVMRQDYDGKKIIYTRTSYAKFKFDEGQDWTLDGEYGGNHKEVRFSILNKAVDILSPENPMFIGETKAIETNADETETKTEAETDNEEKEV